MNYKPCSTLHNIDERDSFEAATTERKENEPTNNSRRSKRSVGIHTKYWRAGRTLNIAMYDEDEETIQKIKSIAKKWLKHTNLKVNFISGEVGDIRIYINFLGDGGGSSAIGTDALTLAPHRPTMVLNIDPTDPRFDYVVLHEFGHVLGLHHEHQHPDADIPWDRPKVYASYKQKFGWSREVVDSDVFPLSRSANTTYGDYDRHSVMHYSVSRETTTGGWEQRENLTLSTKDIATVRNAYPK
ncbi:MULTISPECIES: M12 family metallopeptidase [unclassified Pseudomonas]|uniref:M12 family metallopeptidase n=1 Tax=unclassified Pseudomonas TaxID=196821 RepID=UPI002AC96DBC|nr:MULTISPECIES: M12 family metallopeptidase [unclassified Pseudomonas]MEB0048754.1 M12 family metallopeptidase [Pseudomonas sp. Dout3]MEB0098202.1 M12 family metallopeptidase [Pseudomonas sp. DC1.2]WPX60069.1 M12 family metallopeptidase [Pseudomonas sp. DC1.2]